MKIRLYHFGLFLLFAPIFVASSARIVPISKKVITGFQQGNASMISAFFDETIELNAPNVEGLHSRDQASFILKDFFRTHPSTGFFIKHNGNSKNNAHYSIGELTTSKGNFRVYLLYLKDGESMVIQELRIESDD